jgi:hypothetical protein
MTLHELNTAGAWRADGLWVWADQPTGRAHAWLTRLLTRLFGGVS